MNGKKGLHYVQVNLAKYFHLVMLQMVVTRMGLKGSLEDKITEEGHLVVLLFGLLHVFCFLIFSCFFWISALGRLRLT